MNGANYFTLSVQVLEENMVFIFPKYLKETMNGVLTEGMTLWDGMKYLRL